MYYTADSGRKKESRRMRQVKVAAIQMQCSKNPEENRKKAEKMIRKAAGDGANIILLPELFEREYFCRSKWKIVRTFGAAENQSPDQKDGL